MKFVAVIIVFIYLSTANCGVLETSNTAKKMAFQILTGDLKGANITAHELINSGKKTVPSLPVLGSIKGIVDRVINDTKDGQELKKAIVTAGRVLETGVVNRIQSDIQGLKLMLNEVNNPSGDKQDSAMTSVTKITKTMNEGLETVVLALQGGIINVASDIKEIL